jgi:hypothetical protein
MFLDPRAVPRPLERMRPTNGTYHRLPAKVAMVTRSPPHRRPDALPTH